MSAIEIRGIDHVVLRVTDVSASLRFYCDVLGCREERRLDELGLIQLRAGAALIDLVPIDSPLGREPSYGQYFVMTVEARLASGDVERRSLPLVATNPRASGQR